MQYFKNDTFENKIVDSTETLFSLVNNEIDNFETDAYYNYKLGEVLFDNNLMPLVGAISREVFIKCFTDIFLSWQKCGTFESYINVFKKIFGADASIVFTVPGPGHLQIDIETSNTDLFNFIAREVVSNEYVNSNIVDYDGDNLLLYTQVGIQGEYELEKVLFSMAPNGIFTEISLTIV